MKLWMDHVELEPRQLLWDCGYDRSISLNIVIQFKQWHSKKFQVFGDSKVLSFRQMNQEELFALLQFCYVWGAIWIHDSFKIWPPPDSHTFSNLPIWLNSRRISCKFAGEFPLQPLNFCRRLLQAPTRKLAKRVPNLKKKNMRMIMLLYQQNSFNTSPHSLLHVTADHNHKAIGDGGVLFHLRLFGAEAVAG
nr:hypothetical protein Iba_chr05dCG17190 [Ipomoea batatas]